MFSSSVKSLILSDQNKSFHITADGRKIENKKIVEYYANGNMNYNRSRDLLMNVLLKELKDGILTYQITHFRDNKCDLDEVELNKQFKNATDFKIDFKEVTTKDGFLNEKYVINDFGTACLVDVSDFDKPKKENNEK